MISLSESLRNVMRGWPTGVAVVTSITEEQRHGLTVNSLASVSLEPPMITISLANQSRTRAMVASSGIFAVTLLDETQQHIAEVFAGKEPEEDRFDGLETFTLLTGAPMLKLGRGFLDCKVVHIYPMASSTLFVGEVQAAEGDLTRAPLVYLNRGYHQVEK
jgi:flavin reductase (DIM6/NTAB) family NADH-FMN oxidoreductase RutF